MPSAKSVQLLLSLLCINHVWGQHSGPAAITVTDTVYHTIGPLFHGIQYHRNTFSDQFALDKIADLNLKIIRIWAEVNDFHPEPGVWIWEELDRKIDEITLAGYEPVPCLWGEEWYTGSAGSAWWNEDSACSEWDSAAYRLADRYKNSVSRIIVFDELNMLYPDRDFYIPFKDAALLYLRAADHIKRAAPGILCGGPSGFGGWENGHWANYVLREENGSSLLDFVSSNTFLSWDPADTDEQILARTIWYEEVPLKIKAMTGDRVPPELMLDAYNLSALWTRDGALWTDPRNTGITGGVYQAAALLHSAKGGFDITLHWEIIGGFGILSWYPDFSERAPYYTWKLLVQKAGLQHEARIIGCETSEIPAADAPHHSGMNVGLFTVQPFAVRRPGGGISVVLVNKHADETRTALVTVPAGMKSCSLYRFDASRIHNSCVPLRQENTGPVYETDCPPYSVTVLRFEKNEQTDVQNGTEEPPASARADLLQNYPNPFNARTVISFILPEDGQVRINVFDTQGRCIDTPLDEYLTAGRHQCYWDAGGLASGIYIYQLRTDKGVSTKKLLLL